MTQVAFGPVNIQQGNAASFVIEYFDSNNQTTTPSSGTLTITYTNTSNATQTDSVTLSVVGSFFTGVWSSVPASLGLATWFVTGAGSTSILQEGIIRVIDP